MMHEVRIPWGETQSSHVQEDGTVKTTSVALCQALGPFNMDAKNLSYNQVGVTPCYKAVAMYE